MIVNRQDRKKLQSISMKFEEQVDFGRILKLLNYELFIFYKSEMYRATKSAYEIGYKSGLEANTDKQ